MSTDILAQSCLSLNYWRSLGLFVLALGISTSRTLTLHRPKGQRNWGQGVGPRLGTGRDFGSPRNGTTPALSPTRLGSRKSPWALLCRVTPINHQERAGNKGSLPGSHEENRLRRFARLRAPLQGMLCTHFFHR